MARTSRLFCDGVADCLQGEDEDGELCYKTEDRRLELTTTTTTGPGAGVRLDNGDSFHLGTFADSGGLDLDSSYLDMVIILVIFFISCVTVVGICFILMFVTYKVVKSKRKGGFGHLLTPGREVVRHYANQPG